MIVALIAAGCMIVSDVLAVILVQAEAANRGWLAGLMDMLGWYVGIATTTISVTTLAGRDTASKIWVLVLVGAANVLGTKLGQVTGKWLLGALDAEKKLLLRAARRR
jgi:hypothetical protein